MMRACDCVRVGLLVALMCFVAVVSLGLFACNAGDEPASGHELAAAATTTQEADARAAEAALVRVQPVVHGVYDRRVYVVHGVAEPYKQYRVGFERPGLVERVAVQEGERIGAGATLAMLDTAAAQLARREAVLALEQAEADWTRVHEAQDSFTASQIEEAQRNRERARVALEQAELTLERSVCKAPATLQKGAVVERVYVEPGEVVAAGQPLMTLVDDSTLRIQVRVPGRIVAELQQGNVNAASVRIPDAALTKPALPISRISAVADAVRQYQVELELANDQQQVRAGMIAEVTLALSPRNDVTVLPMGAAIRYGDEYVVWFAARDNDAPDELAAHRDEADDEAAMSPAPTQGYRARRWSIPVADAELWHNDLITPHAPPHELLILEGYQGLLEREPIRLERNEE